MRSRRGLPFANAFATLRPVLANQPRITLALALVGLLSAGCGGQKDESIAGRLWVDHLPNDARDEVVSLMIVDVKGRAVGVGHRGTAFRGSYFSFRWEQQDSRGTMTMLQDGREFRVAIESCTPDEGFDYCVDLHGDPSGATRYQSRKRWGIRSVPVSTNPAAIWPAVVEALSADDEALVPMLAGASSDAAGG